MLIPNFVNPQIGTGTNTSSANAVLDVNSTTAIIEVKVYKKGTSLHYFFYKLSNIIVRSAQFGVTTGGTGQSEVFSIEAKIYGWKDNVTGFSIAFDTTIGGKVAYWGIFKI